MTKSILEAEREATERIRRARPQMRVRTLASWIKAESHRLATFDSDLTEADIRRASQAPFYTIYSRIRRFDARQKTSRTFNEGGRVRVARCGRKYEHTRRFQNSWEPGMDYSVGNVFTVRRHAAATGVLLSDRFEYPPQVLELVTADELVPA